MDTSIAGSRTLPRPADLLRLLALVAVVVVVAGCDHDQVNLPPPPAVKDKLLDLEPPEFDCALVTSDGAWGALGESVNCGVGASAGILEDALNVDSDQSSGSGQAIPRADWEAMISSVADSYKNSAEKVRRGEVRMPFASELRGNPPPHPGDWSRPCNDFPPGAGGFTRGTWSGCTAGAMELFVDGAKLALEECALTSCNEIERVPPALLDRVCSSSRTICKPMINDGWEAIRNLPLAQRALAVVSSNLFDELRACAEAYDGAVSESVRQL